MTAEAVIGVHIQRIEQGNARLNAVVQLASAAALQQARGADDAVTRAQPLGPLHGVPITVNDSIATAGKRVWWPSPVVSSYSRRSSGPKL